MALACRDDILLERGMLRTISKPKIQRTIPRYQRCINNRSGFSCLGDVRFLAEQCTPPDLVIGNEFNRTLARSCIDTHHEKDTRGRRGSGVLCPVGGLGKLVLVWVPDADERQPVSDYLFCKCLFSRSLGPVGSRAVSTDQIPLKRSL